MPRTSSTTDSPRILLALGLVLAGIVGLLGPNLGAGAQEATPSVAATPATENPCDSLLNPATPEPPGAGETGDGTAAAVTIDQIPFDLLFIDAMTRHHLGGITMAEVALARSERPEVQEFARAMIETQQAEIAQLAEWRAAWYPDAANVPEEFQVALMDEGSAIAGGTADVGMGGSGAGLPSPETNAVQLCQIEDATAFDTTFAEMMIAHHQTSIGMGMLAQERADHQEIKDFAQNLITAQTEEIGQLAAWRDQWTGLSAGTPAA